jgi:hypothetical protein
MTNSRFRLIIIAIILVGLFPMILTTKTHALEISPEKANYIMNVCSGRYLVSDLEAESYCTDLNLCLDYKSVGECYADLKNGLINNFGLGLVD